MKKSKFVYFLAVAMSILLILAACGGNGTDEAIDGGSENDANDSGEQANEAIKIGYIAPLTGRAQTYGKLQHIAMEMAVEDINEAGGVNGHPIELVAKDDQLDPSESNTMFRQLEREGVFAIFGPMSGSSWELAAPLANDLEIPAINMNATLVGVTTPPWSFRVVPDDEKSLPVAVDGLLELNPDIQRVVLVGDIREASAQSAISEFFPLIFEEKGIEVVGTVEYETGTTDFAPVINRIQSYEPDAIASAGLLPQSINLARELERAGMSDIPVVSSMLAWPGNFIHEGGTAVENWVTSGFYADNMAEADSEGFQAFIDEYRSRSEEDSSLPVPATIANNAIAYDMLHALTEIMAAANLTADSDIEEARTAIRDGLSALTGHSGLVSDVTINEDNEVDLPIIPLKTNLETMQWEAFE